MEIQWPLIIFTLCITLSAGLFAGMGLLGLLKRPISQRTGRITIIIALAVLVFGGAASFLHLQHWDRAFNGFGNLTSGITHELIGALVMIILLLIAFVLLRQKDTLPGWMNVVALAAGVLLSIVLANSYFMPSRPVWGSFVLYIYYLAQTLLLGSVGLWALSAILKEECALLLSKWALATAAFQLVVLGIYAAAINGTASQFPQWGNYFDWTAPNRPATDFDLIGRLVGGDAAPWFWGGAIVAGTILPAVLALIGSRGTKSGAPIASVAILCALGGGIAFRVILYLLGITVVPF
jgi:anaerobic dimethyl sulfoxide reductase subunit C (anchor subunit)